VELIFSPEEMLDKYQYTGGATEPDFMDLAFALFLSLYGIKDSTKKITEITQYQSGDNRRGKAYPVISTAKQEENVILPSQIISLMIPRVLYFT